jgi:hypothetical protein
VLREVEFWGPESSLAHYETNHKIAQIIALSPIESQIFRGEYMATINADLAFLQAGVSEMKAYLLSDLLFWPLSARPQSGGPAFPSLTLGGLLLARTRLRARGSFQSEGKLVKLEEELEANRHRWGSAWVRKANWEFSSRLRQWQNFMEEYRQNPEAQAGFFKHEVGLRVMLALLAGAESEPPEAESEMLKALDRLLKLAFINGEFIWEPGLESGFPPETYWFLYGHLKG